MMITTKVLIVFMAVVVLFAGARDLDVDQVEYVDGTAVPIRIECTEDSFTYPCATPGLELR